MFAVLARGRRAMVAALVAASFLAGLVESALLALIAQVAASLVEGSSSIAADLGAYKVELAIGPVLAIAFGCALFRLALLALVAYLPARLGAEALGDMRRRLFDRYLDASWVLQAEERDGDLQELMTNQVSEVTRGLLQVAVLATSALAVAALLASALFLSVPVALTSVVAAYVLAAVLRPLNRRGRQEGYAYSTRALELADGVNEAVQQSQETQVFGTAAAQRRQVSGLIRDAGDSFLRTVFIGRLVASSYQGLAAVLIVGGLTGLHLSNTGRIGVLGAVVLMLVRSATYAQMAQASYHLVIQAAPFLERIQAAEGRFEAAAHDEGTRPVGALRSLGFDHVSLDYERSVRALDDVTFDVSSGEVVGVVGPSGAGKSSLLQVLLRLREPSSGTYLVNGSPAAEIRRPDWHGSVAFVPQEPRLIHGSVSHNISYFRDLDQDTIEAAARLAQIHDDVERWPKGYESIIGQRSDGVSGGERQRICLARALAADPEMIVLDEPTSALDARSEMLVQHTLRQLRGRMTIFVVSHRLSTLSFCDRIMVIENGQLAAFDRPEAIARSNPYFRSTIELTTSTVS